MIDRSRLSRDERNVLIEVLGFMANCYRSVVARADDENPEHGAKWRLFVIESLLAELLQ